MLEMPRTSPQAPCRCAPPSGSLGSSRDSEAASVFGRRPLDCQTPRRSIGELRALSSLRARTDSQAAREASDDELRGVFAGPGGVAPVRPYVPDG